MSDTGVRHAPATQRGATLRLLEPLAALSLVTDLAHGRPAEQALQAALLAVHVARHIGETSEGIREALYVTLLRSLGCTATSHEYAVSLGGDDIAVRREGDMIDPANPRDGIAFVRRLARTQPAGTRLGVLATGMVRGPRVAADAARADCEVARQLATRLGLGGDVADALFQGFERWDGRGHPSGLRGDAIQLSARVAAVASSAVLFRASVGDEAAASVLRRWSGHALDPALVTAVVSAWPHRQQDEPDDLDALEALLEAEPAPALTASDIRLDDVAATFATVADLKAVHLQGHSNGVASLASRAAELHGEDAATVTTIRRAALMHDLGRAAVPTGVWERPGRLSSAEWEQVRLHSYQTQRILARSAVLAPLARVAGMHHERIDGSGYHRGSSAAEQDRLCRILAAADVYHALTEPRPHRPAFSPDAAAQTAREMPLDHEALEAVLEAAGHVRRRTRAWPAGLTQREVDVLRLVVRGMTMRQVAKQLFISTSTVHTHLAHAYEKAGVSTRAAAAVFSMEHDLLEP